MVFEEFELAGLEEGNRLGKLEIGGFRRSCRELLRAVGADDGETHQIRSD